MATVICQRYKNSIDPLTTTPGEQEAAPMPRWRVFYELHHDAVHRMGGAITIITIGRKLFDCHQQHQQMCFYFCMFLFVAVTYVQFTQASLLG